MEHDICLGLRIHVPFWCSFRDPLTSNVHRTFPLPPPTTLYGLCAAALGLAQDDVSRRAQMRFAIAVTRAGEMVETYSTWKKGSEDTYSKTPAKDKPQKLAALNSIRSRGELPPDDASWASTPIIRQKLIQPVYTVGVWCSPECSRDLQAAFKAPAHPLYLGESDDGIDVETLGEETPQLTQELATGAVSGVQSGGILASLPRQFKQQGRSWELERWLVTVPRAGVPIQASGEVWACFGQVWSFEPEFPVTPPIPVAFPTRRGRPAPSADATPDFDGAQGRLF